MKSRTIDEFISVKGLYAQESIGNILCQNEAVRNEVLAEAALCWSQTSGLANAYERLDCTSSLLAELIRERLEKMLPADSSPVAAAVLSYALNSLEFDGIARWFVILQQDDDVGERMQLMPEEPLHDSLRLDYELGTYFEGPEDFDLDY